MAVNKRFLIWLIRAYIKKWGKVLLISFLGGLLGFFLVIFLASHFSHFFPQRQKIGVVGAYTLETLPQSITRKLSRGLTMVTDKGEVRPDLASSWEVKDQGKKYIFHLKKGIFFLNGREVTSDLLTYSFKDVHIQRPDKYTIVFLLKDQYAPFLVTVSKPIFPKGMQGLGDFTIEDLKLNGGYITYLSLINTKNKKSLEDYTFYPNQDALKVAFLLGEATEITGISDLNVAGTNLSSHKNILVRKLVNYNQLVTLFYNTKDEILSDNKLRKGLTYSLPDVFPDGETAFLPIPPTSIFFSKDISSKTQDLAHAQILINSNYGSASHSARGKITLTTLSKYRPVAEKLASIWKELGVNVEIKSVQAKPDHFQIYLGDFLVPKDPDQYELWHSKSDHNITRFDSKRIDKLLEDGRQTTDLAKRIKIYDEFQRFLVDDAVTDTPASFLYFPFSYSVVRK